MTDKFVSPCPPPTPFERELLEILIEECAEVQQRATKMLRFGVLEVQPGQDLDNAARLSLEVGDLKKIIDKCRWNSLIDDTWVSEGYARKERQLAKYMQNKKD